MGEPPTKSGGAMQPLRVVLVACTAPRQTQQWQLSLPQGATVADALKACGQGAALSALSIGCEEGRGLIGVAVVIACGDLGVTEACLAANGVHYHKTGARLVVAPEKGQGVTFAFEELK